MAGPPSHLDLRNRLRLAVRGGNERRIIEAVKAAGEQSVAAAVPLLLKLLRTDERIGVKNAAAMALRELRADRAVPILVELIADPRFSNRNGTFVYALQTLNWYRDHAAEVAGLLTDRSFEVRLMALQALEDAIHDLSLEQRTAVLFGLLRPLAVGRRLNSAAQQTLSAALELLTRTKLPGGQRLLPTG